MCVFVYSVLFIIFLSDLCLETHYSLLLQCVQYNIGQCPCIRQVSVVSQRLENLIIALM